MSLSQSTRVDELEQQLAQAEADGEKMAAKLAAAEHMIAHALDGYFDGQFDVTPAFRCIDGKWIVYWPRALALLGDNGEPRRFDNWYDAYKAAKAVGWP